MQTLEDPMQAADVIEREQLQIMTEWEYSARKAGAAARQSDQLALRNRLPVFLEILIKYLRSPGKLEHETEISLLGGKHGSVRATDAGYSLKQALYEFHLLRTCLFSACERHAPLSNTERDIILDCIDRALLQAAREFSEDRSSGEKEARRVAETRLDISREEVRVMKREAGQREDFVASLSHDLRNPIGAAKMALEIMVAETTAAKYAPELPDIINRNLDHAESLIRNLLDVSLIRAGQKLQLNLGTCDLADIIQEAVSELGPDLAGRVAIEKMGPAEGWWDAEGLRRVAVNLLTNAFKYGAVLQSVTVRISRWQGHTSLAVHNKGRKISEADQKALFEPYIRSREAVKGNAPGWGLGLAFVKGMVEAHGGSVRVESCDDTGTTFFVTLPTDPGHSLH